MVRILLVDDDPQSLSSTKKILEFSGYEVVTATDGQTALDIVRPNSAKPSLPFQLILSDVRMPRLGGLEFLKALSLYGETTPVLLMTAYGQIEDAVWAMKLGAVDFLTKPFKRQTLLSAVELALKRRSTQPFDQTAKLPLAATAEKSSIENSLIGRSDAIHSLNDLIGRVAPTQATILLTGESGTGKERVARCLHLRSARASKPFVAINCAAVPEQLMESELFGYEKGAFSGAVVAKEGLFEAAHGGSLLLDEIGDMPYSLQAKLLRVLQEGEFRRLGSTHSKRVDVRVIAATHQDLHSKVSTGAFRQDLLYRLEVIHIHVPPLRERAEDIPELTLHFLNLAKKKHLKEIEGISTEALSYLCQYRWPGNVRELSNVIERAVILSGGPIITPQELPSHLITDPSILTAKIPSKKTISIPLGTPLKDVEELLIRKTLEATDGDKNMTAKLLGINSRTIYRKLDKKAVPAD